MVPFKSSRLKLAREVCMLSKSKHFMLTINQGGAIGSAINAVTNKGVTLA